MSTKYPGGIISKTPPVPAGPYETGAASGIWTIDQATNYIKQGLWPTAGLVPTDAQFNYVTMLLHGDGTNGAQNNTFLDSSTNNFTITRNGNTTQGSFSPYGSNWSTYFDNASLLTFTQQSFASDFTIEFWMYQTASSTGGGYCPIVESDSGAYNFPLILDYGGDGYLGAYFQSGSPSGSTGAKVFSTNTWTHIAVSRSGSSNKYFVNGTLVLTLTGTPTLLVDKIGGYSTVGSGFLYSGYLSNLRITNTAVYTSNFTPSTVPLTAISGTQLLTCQSNWLVDNSTNNLYIANTGLPSVQRFNPFGTSTAYSTATIGGSGYFDGTGDKVTAPSSSAFNFGTGDFTISMLEYCCLQNPNSLLLRKIVPLLPH